MIELIMVMSLWGTLGAFVLWSGLSAIDIAFYRCLLGAAIMGIWLLRSNTRLSLNKNTGTTALAGICLVLNWIFLFKSFQVSSITIGNMSYYLQPIILIIMGIFIYNEKVNLRKWGMIFLALLGVLLTADLQHPGSPHIISGMLWAVLAAFLYSIVTVLMKNNRTDYPVVLFIQMTVGTLLLLPFVHFHPLSGVSVLCLACIGLVHTLLAYFLYYRAIKKVSISNIAILSYLDPIVAIASDVLFFGRQLNGIQIAGIILTFGALYWMVRSPDMSTNTNPADFNGAVF